MEMEYRDNSRRGKIIIVLGIVLALATGGAAYFVINQAQQRAGTAGLQTVPVVVAQRQIPARKPIEPDDVQVRAVPIDATNEQGIFADPNLVVGRVLAVPVLPGQLVTANLMASTSSGGTFSIIGPTETIGPDSEAWRAVSLTVPDDRAVGGLVEANMTVDVFVTAQVNVPQDLLDAGRYYTDKSTKITYQNMVVLAKSGQFYVVRAPLAVAEEISHLQAAGNALFSLALRPEQDVRLADASGLGATTNLLIRRYGLPIPETFPPGQGPIPTAQPTSSPTPASSEEPDDSALVSPAP
jgi:Flp pilus assembly protein CpaB